MKEPNYHAIWMDLSLLAATGVILVNKLPAQYYLALMVTFALCHALFAVCEVLTKAITLVALALNNIRKDMP